MPASKLYQDALGNFREARGQAALQEILSRFTGKSNRLLSYEEVAQKLRLGARVERGIQSIPVAAIVGSVGRYADFTRTFLPRRADDQERWARVKSTFTEPGGPEIPPIEVYQVGDAYFVVDGNHRVSIARQMGIAEIDAHVIQIPTPIPLSPDVQPDDLIAKAEYADLLHQTQLAELRPGLDLSTTEPGHYRELLVQIEAHRYLLEQKQGNPITLWQAAGDWYDQVYSPFVSEVRERGLMRWFSGRTEADLYLWVSEHRGALEKELGWEVRPEAAVTDLARREDARVASEEGIPGAWRKARLFDRYTETLFQDILVPVSSNPAACCAQDMAVAIAQREGARLHGLHLVSSEGQRTGGEALALRASFQQRCEAAGVTGRLAIESGDPVTKICERALLADLVVVNISNPPAVGLSSLGSPIRSLIWRLARPLLAVPGVVGNLDRALLAYDGSPKSKEALFVAAYLAERWKTHLTILTVVDKSRVPPNAAHYVRDYLELHEIEAEYIVENRGIAILLDLIAERQIGLVLLGGYSVSTVQELMGGSAVNFLLREAHTPLLICR